MFLRINNDLRDSLINARAVWKVAQGNIGSIRFREQTYSREEAALLWMNGGYFHSDLEKYEELEKAPSRGWRVVQAHFGDFVVNATRVVLYTGVVVEYGKEHNLVKFRVLTRSDVACASRPPETGAR